MQTLLEQLPPSPPGKTGWPWTEETPPGVASRPDAHPWPKITIVTPSFNQAEFLEETIRSVLLQNYPALEYIIIDGGSTDNSVEIIKNYEPWLAYWVSAPDKGQTDAINKGLAKAKGEILGWLNSDDVYYPGTLQRVAAIKWEKTDFCYGKGMWISRSGNEIGLYPTMRPNKYSLLHKCVLCQPTVFFKQNTFQEIDLFSLQYHCVFDYEYWMRAVFHGKKFHFIPHLLAQSRMYPENKSLSGRTTVRTEDAALKNQYYRGLRLNPLISRLYGLFVRHETRKKEKALTNWLRTGNQS